ncbi:hypothetical protein QVD17_15306 [Tagetes erecta]|uniref:Uncharacterized protein n=1 Tax=Tagetes erecta TaxID=13708 RepID=A0AAD8KP10_TARER|nr:hypothetical protein QVD17_15306 [Tagetes erecta]
MIYLRSWNIPKLNKLDHLARCKHRHGLHHLLLITKPEKPNGFLQAKTNYCYKLVNVSTNNPQIYDLSIAHNSYNSIFYLRNCVR